MTVADIVGAVPTSVREEAGPSVPERSWAQILKL